jgi:hypothetical protein
MNNVTSLSSHRRARQTGNVTTPERALQDGVSPACLRAVAARNERKGAPRNMAQAKALYRVADQLEAINVESYREAA